MRSLTLNESNRVTGAMTRDEFDPVLSPLTASAILLVAGCLGAASGAGISLALSYFSPSVPSMISSAVGGFIIGHTFCVERMYAYAKHQGLLGYPI